MSDLEHHDPIDPDHALVDRLLTLHPPANDDVAWKMAFLRGIFLNLAHTVVNHVPRTPDRTVALRSIHRACMDTIATLACNQDQIEEVGGRPELPQTPEALGIHTR